MDFVLLISYLSDGCVYFNKPQVTSSSNNYFIDYNVM